MAGSRTLLIDADIRHPNVHNMLGFEAGPGLCELLTYDLKQKIRIHSEFATGLNVLQAGVVHGSSADLLRSPQMDSLMGELRHRYDWIFLDSSALEAVVDGIILAKHADLIVYVALWLKTTRIAVESGIKQLRDVGVKSINVALNRVDIDACHKYKDLFEMNYYGYYHTVSGL